MRKVSRSALVTYSAEQMIALVGDILAYPTFLPWCSGATVHSHEGSCVEASLELSRGGISKRFRTRNDIRGNEAMDISLVGGPFSHLSGGWRFKALGEEGSKVSLELQFQFENKVTDALFGHYFEETCNSLIESFVNRAHDVYGGP